MIELLKINQKTYNELKKLKTFNFNYFEGKNYFEGDDGTQNTLVLQVKIIYFKHDVDRDAGGFIIYVYDVWKSKSSSNQNLYYSLNKVDVTTKLLRPTHVVLGADEYFLGVNKITTNNSIVNIYIVYKL